MYWFDTDLDLMVYAITDTKKGEQGLRLLIFKLPQHCVRLVFTLFHDLLCLLSLNTVSGVRYHPITHFAEA